MNDDIITLLIDNVEKNYQLLFVIDDEYKYVIYTDIENKDKLYAIKVKELNKEEKAITITDEEWKMIETKYQELLKNKNA